MSSKHNSTTEAESIVEFVPLNNFEDYEILNIYPYEIRRKDNHYKVKTFNNNGYIALVLNGKIHYKHVLIANQFLVNDDPESKKVVDHVNRDKTDFHLSNLRFASYSTNSRNRSSNMNIKYKLVDSIPDDAIKVNEYSHHTFEEYYFYDNRFYFFNGIEYRLMHVNETKLGYKYKEKEYLSFITNSNAYMI